jgi:hypothetical protein
MYGPLLTLAIRIESVLQIKIFHALLVSIKHAPMSCRSQPLLINHRKKYTFFKFPYYVTLLGAGIAQSV